MLQAMKICIHQIQSHKLKSGSTVGYHRATANYIILLLLRVRYAENTDGNAWVGCKLYEMTFAFNYEH
jgi:hypothetical protein